MPRSVTSAFRETTEYTTAGYVTRSELAIIPPEADIEAARDSLQRLSAPPSNADLKRELLHLFLATVSRESGVDIKGMGAAYGKHLIKHDGDIVLAVLRERQAYGSKWHPALPELIEEIEKRELSRRRMAAAISPEAVDRRRQQIEQERQDRVAAKERQEERQKFLAENPSWKVWNIPLSD